MSTVHSLHQDEFQYEFPANGQDEHQVYIEEANKSHIHSRAIILNRADCLISPVSLI
jgi:hypothetical protein